MGRFWPRIADAVERLRIGAPPVVGPTGELAYALSLHWRRDIFMIISARMDEAGTDGRSECLTMGGFVATIPQWNDFDRGWRKRLKRAGLDDFHAIEFWGNKSAAARNLSFPMKQEFVRGLWALQSKRLRFGFTTRLDNSLYDAYNKARPNWLHRDSQFGLCFRMTVGLLVSTSAKYLGEDIRINFLLEQGHKNIGDAARVHSEIRNDSTDPDFARKLGTFSTGLRTAYPGLQAADGIIATAQRIEGRNADDDYFHDVPTEASSLTDLATEEIPIPVFRYNLTQSVIDDYLSARTEHQDAIRAAKQKAWKDRQAAKAVSESSEGE